jgi:multicomponent Na+:H+ antiporter subunit B
MNLFLIGIFSLILALLAFTLLRVKSLFVTMILLSAYSGGSAVLLCLLGAPDVAFTEVVVGGGVSTVLLVALLRRTDPYELPRRSSLFRAGAALATLSLAGALFLGILALPPFGDPEAPAARHVSPYFAERSLAQTRTPNLVTAVLADYRGFDTLIETAVIATAAVGSVLVLRRGP